VATPEFICFCQFCDLAKVAMMIHRKKMNLATFGYTLIDMKVKFWAAYLNHEYKQYGDFLSIWVGFWL
jgi:hypothetical protein